MVFVLTMTHPVLSSPALEVLHFPASGAAPKGLSKVPPLLFVHGAFCGAWVWEEHFLPYFASKGFDAYALSLRGHGKSEGSEALRDTSLAEFCEDLSRTAADVESEHGVAPVLIGHSMGGMVVQRVVESFDLAALKKGQGASAMVLMSSVPPGGLWGTSLNMMLRDPFLFMQMGALQAFGAGAATVSGVHRAMFTGDTPVDLTAAYLSRLQEESLRVQLDLSTAPPPVATNGTSIPTLVVGADEDAFVPPWMAQTTGRHYHAPCTILANEGHAMMLGQKWQVAADLLLEWMTDKAFV
jgi:pimeloyl-ACP methyl ester carboxylesterase